MSYLPGILAQIATVTCEATALTLARELGGTPLKLSADPNGKLAKLVGQADAQAIVNEWRQGETIVIPMANARGLGARRAQVVQHVARMLEADISVNKTALSADVHSRTVKRIKAKLKTGVADLPLFKDL